MKSGTAEYVNIGLMGIALVAAAILPFEVFLFSYAFLGPLHYLTEISWLHDRQYFSPKKRDWIPLVALSFLILFGSSMILGQGWVDFLNNIPIGKDGLGTFLGEYGYDMTFIAFGIALLFVLSKNTWIRVYGVVGIIFAAFLFHAGTEDPGVSSFEYGAYFKVFAIYMPTLIHVYLFTGAFILFGALKRNKASGYISFGFFVLCGVLAFILPANTGYEASAWARDAYEPTFGALSKFGMADFMGMSPAEAYTADLFTAGPSLILARFIAFAYTYHYLNWFSKTSIIQWHKVPRARFIAVIALYVASIALYLASYDIGFRWLFLLSFAHVLLEFPLNHQSFIGIGRELRAKLFGKPQAAASK